MVQCNPHPSLHARTQGVLINLGWESDAANKLTGPEALAQLPMDTLCPLGFVFIWAPKQHIAGVVARMYAWSFAYVENLTWVWLAPNHTVLTLPSPCAQRSHLTLFIFRREGAPRTSGHFHASQLSPRKLSPVFMLSFHMVQAYRSSVDALLYCPFDVSSPPYLS